MEIEKGWHTITIPDSLMDRVQRIPDNDILGYGTKYEFIREAMDQRIIDLKKAELCNG
ncbi:MAG: hypothetical protein QXU18_02315 [Thermoplasmatales archaeon]